MKIELRDKIQVSTSLSRKDGELLLNILKKCKEFKNKEDHPFRHLIAEIEDELAPLYIHHIKCCGCGGRHKIYVKKPLTKEDKQKMEQYHLCESCYNSEDFK